MWTTIWINNFVWSNQNHHHRNRHFDNHSLSLYPDLLTDLTIEWNHCPVTKWWQLQTNKQPTDIFKHKRLFVCLNLTLWIYRRCGNINLFSKQQHMDIGTFVIGSCQQIIMMMMTDLSNVLTNDAVDVVNHQTIINKPITEKNVIIDNRF